MAINGLLGVLLACGIGLGYVSLTGGDDSATASATRAVTVTRGTVASTVSASGSVGSARSRTLTFATSGTVSAIYVQAGDKVSKGKLLARLDQTSAEENVRSAKASLAASEAADTSTASGYSSYVSAKNAYDQAERQLAGTELRAPFTGTVIAARPSGAGWEADLLVGDAPFTCRLPSRLDAAQVSVTLLDPPCFGPDGALRGEDRSRPTRSANPA